jgi:hypothetical protein
LKERKNGKSALELDGVPRRTVWYSQQLLLSELFPWNRPSAVQAAGAVQDPSREKASLWEVDLQVCRYLAAALGSGKVLGEPQSLGCLVAISMTA